MAAPITLTVSVTEWRETLISRLERSIGLTSRTVHDTRSVGGDPKSPTSADVDFLSGVHDTVVNFMARSNRKTVTLYFRLPQGSDWNVIRRSPALLYTHVIVRHELHVEDEGRAEEQRREQQRREEEEERRATAARAALKAKDDARLRERARLAPRVKELATTVAGRTMYWSAGRAFGAYVNGDFLVTYHPRAEHKDSDEAIRRANSAENRQRIERALWDAYWHPGSQQVIYEPPAPLPDDVTAEDGPHVPLDPEVHIDKHEASILQVDWVRKNYAATMQESVEAVLPTSAIDIVALAALPFTPQLIRRLNVLRSLGRISQIWRLPVRYRQWDRVTTKAAKMDPELLRYAWSYRYRRTINEADEADEFYRNFMAARVEVNGRVTYVRSQNIESSPVHSESELQPLIRELRAQHGPDAKIRIQQLFTERIPCQYCRVMLDKEFPYTEIFYVVGRGRGRAGELFNYYFDVSRFQ